MERLEHQRTIIIIIIIIMRWGWGRARGWVINAYQQFK
jgi:hypothetical protein